jgi:hypothetical protein
MANARNMNVYVEYSEQENIGAIISAIREKHVKMFDVELARGDAKSGIAPSVIFSVHLPRKYKHSDFIAMLSEIEGVTIVEEL